ncbi:TetR/AcrR family transcriptional regulator [Culicoidibacter larvae]|uniref:TetR/AcrR family transcriptional regulator n=2 Tax=Culicoidibacter larvae TaxID=2579976 RepID=A0A5R8QHR5_9FIRM|nr:TetR/AcrR family transcriptional regulator [Culicoidibacter larvae]
MFAILLPIRRPCMTKHELKKLETKQKIIEAFWTIYTKNGIEKTTIKEITALAKCNRSTFYAHFEDVYSLLEEIEDSLIPTIHELPPTKIKTEDELLLASETILDMYKKNAKYFTVLLGEKGDPRFQRKMKDTLKPLVKQMLISRGQKNDAALDYTVEYYLSGALGLMMYIFSQENAPDTEKVLSIIQNLQPIHPNLPFEN